MDRSDLLECAGYPMPLVQRERDREAGMQQTLIFDGNTFDRKRDAKRLTGLLLRVRDYMLSHEDWRTLSQIRDACGGSEASCSARIRDLRKPHYQTDGPLVVDAVCKQRGLWYYRVKRGTEE